MKIAMLGSVGNINRHVIPELIKKNNEVTVITSNDKRVAQIKDMGAMAAVGSMDDAKFLTEMFTGKDVVYLMISGIGTGSSLNESMTKQGKIFKEAIEKSGIKKVVQLSSVGADNSKAGSLYAYHFLEEELKKINGIDLAFVRPVGFYANLYSNMESIKKSNVIYSSLDEKLNQKWVAPTDIANVILPLILNTPTGVTVNYAVSDEFSMKDFIDALSKEANIADLHKVSITNEQMKQGMIQNGVPEHVADALAATNRFQAHPDELYADLNKHNPQYGEVKLTDFVKEYAQALKNNGGKSNTLSEQSTK